MERQSIKHNPDKSDPSSHTAYKEHPFYTLKEILGNPLSRTQALTSIQTDASASQIFSSLPPDEQERLLIFIQGAKGLKITYDAFFKYVMNPEVHPSRLEEFLSAVLNQKITIHAVLPIEGTRMAEKGSFVIMDIIVELSDGSIVNIEIQKIGYLFPGERASCYISDFIMRQYNRVRNKLGKNFSFHNLKPVILIVLMEKSAAAFKAVYPKYMHREKISYDSNVKVSSLYKTIYISLDTFRSVVHNIDTPLKAWLTFFSSDQPADIIRLVNAYPQFLACYHDIMEFRRNPKELIYMYSEALAILDRNTEIYMCEELQKEVEHLKKTIDEKNAILSKTNEAIFEKNAILLKQVAALSEINAELSEKDAALIEKNAELFQKDTALSEKDAALSEKDAALSEKDAALSEKDAEIAFLRNQLREIMQNK